MQLFTLGKLELSGLSSAKLSPQLLLLLSYVRLEGNYAKEHLARLFWPHLAQAYSKRGERKDLNNVSVALASLRREAGLEPEAIAHLSCDAVTFTKVYKESRYDLALELYHNKGFLADIEHKPRLKLSSELYDWVVQKRALLAEQAFQAALHLATQDKTHSVAFLEQASQLWQEAFGIQAFARLYKLAEQLDALSPELEQLCTNISASYLDDLPEDMLEFYLLLALQSEYNLNTARITANLSPKQALHFQKELSVLGFFSEDLVMNTKVLARRYLENQPVKKLDLLTRLLSTTPTEESYGLFEQLYQLSHSFGGLGYWQKAQDAYSFQIERCLKEQRFVEALKSLEHFINVESGHQQTPDPYLHFLHAYTLARVARYAEGLQTLHHVRETLEVRAIKAGLLLATGHKIEAELLAQTVLEDPYQSRQTDWARGLAANTLGTIHHYRQALTEADQYLAQAATHFELAGMHYRSLGMHFNRSSVLLDMGNTEKAKAILEMVIQKTQSHTLLQVRSLVNLGFIYLLETKLVEALAYFEKAYHYAKEEAFAKTHVGIYASTLSTWSILAYSSGKLSKHEAQEHLEKASGLAQTSGNRKEHSKTLVHLAIVKEDVAAFETSWLMLKQFAGLHECAIYQTPYQQLLEQSLQDARARQDEPAQIYYAQKLKHLLDSNDFLSAMEQINMPVTSTSRA